MKFLWTTNHWRSLKTDCYSTLIPPNKLSPAKFSCFFNIECASVLLKVGENVVRVSNILDPGETPSYLASHPEKRILYTAHLIDAIHQCIKLYCSFKMRQTHVILICNLVLWHKRLDNARICMSSCVEYWCWSILKSFQGFERYSSDMKLRQTHVTLVCDINLWPIYLKITLHEVTQK